MVVARSARRPSYAAPAAVLRVDGSPPATGSPRDDPHAILDNLQRGLLRPNGMAVVGTLLAGQRRSREPIARFRGRVVASRHRPVRAAPEEARARGELRPEANPNAAVNLLLGPFSARYLSGEPVPPGWPERVVTTVRDGIGGGGGGDRTRGVPAIGGRDGGPSRARSRRQRPDPGR